MKLNMIVNTMVKKVNTIVTKINCNRYIKQQPVDKMFSIFLFHQYMGLHYDQNVVLHLKHPVLDSKSISNHSELSKKLLFRLQLQVWNNNRMQLNILRGDVSQKD